MNSHRSSRIYPIVALVFGAVFVFSGFLKARDPQLFLISIRGFHLLPDPYAAFLALGLPWLEIVCGFAVSLGLLRRGGLLLLNSCLMVFALAILISLARGLDIECGCFGSKIRLSAGMELGLDILLLVAGVWLTLGRSRAAAHA